MIRKLKGKNELMYLLKNSFQSLIHPVENSYFGFFKFYQSEKNYVCDSNKTYFQTLGKELVSYISSRNMRKTITRSNIVEENSEFKLTNNFKEFLVYLMKTFRVVPKQVSNAATILRFLNILGNKNNEALHSFSMDKVRIMHESQSSKQNLTEKQEALSKEKLEESWGGPDAYKLLVFLKDDFDDVLKNNHQVLVFFFSSWCAHCTVLKKVYGTVAVKAKEANLSVVFANFDINFDPEVAFNKGVIGIPILKYYESGKFVSNFKGKRNVENLLDFAKNPHKYVEEAFPKDV